MIDDREIWACAKPAHSEPDQTARSHGADRRVALMPMGTRHRVTGFLIEARRGLVLEMDEGGVYALDAEPAARKLLGHRVTVEGGSIGST